MIIIPDVHGRTFWKEAIESIKEGDTLKDIVIFLGDYLDPYGYEGISVEDAIANFEEIIDLKKQYPNNIILLLGNHDCGYIWPIVCEARRSREYYNDINNMFESNMNLFDLSFVYTTEKKKYLFSHAGIHKVWFDKFVKDIKAEIINYDYISNIINNTLHNNYYHDMLRHELAEYSSYRGWLGGEYGSCVWADIREWSSKWKNYEYNRSMGYYQIFGHTQLESEPIINDDIACLDVRRYFILTPDDILIDSFDNKEYDLNNLNIEE